MVLSGFAEAVRWSGALLHGTPRSRLVVATHLDQLSPDLLPNLGSTAHRRANLCVTEPLLVCGQA